MVFDELLPFSKRVVELLDDESFWELQIALLARPDLGKVVKSSGGLRKMRWAAKGRGKRGGLRVIYYWWVANSKITFCDIYTKNEKEDVTTKQLKGFREALGI